MIDVGSVVRCVPNKNNLDAKSPMPPWSDCQVEFGDVGIVTSMYDKFSTKEPLHRVAFFRWPDEEIHLGPQWLEECDD